MNKISSNARNQSLDLLKLLMAFLVMGIHGIIFSDINSYVSYIFVNGICRISVQVFLIISGYYLYNVNDYKGFLKRIKHLAII